MPLDDVRYTHHTQDIDVRQSHYLCANTFRTFQSMESQELLDALKAQKVTHQRIADELDIDRTAVTKMLNKKRKVQASELPKLVKLLKSFEGAESARQATPLQEQHDESTLSAYVSVVRLPTFGGMGGGGTGEGAIETALVPRQLIEDSLHGKPDDFMLVDCRGDSMKPLLLHGDQVLVDLRDRNPIQGGPFALRFQDGYVIKNVEVLHKEKKLRVFPSNPEYREEIYGENEIEGQLEIVGRPVWFARQL